MAMSLLRQPIRMGAAGAGETAAGAVEVAGFLSAGASRYQQYQSDHKNVPHAGNMRLLGLAVKVESITDCNG